MNTAFTTYSTKNFQNLRRNLCNQARTSNFDKVFEYTEDWLLNTEFYLENKNILDQKRGAGFWLWKPYIIKECLMNLDYGDVVFYLDAGDIFSKDLAYFLRYYFSQHQNVDCLLTLGAHAQKLYTKRDCFVVMDCDYPHYHHHTQLEAGILCFKKTDRIMGVLDEWIRYGKNEKVMTDLPNEYGENYPGFIEHRWDQSIISNLAIKYGLNMNSELRSFVQCNINTP